MDQRVIFVIAAIKSNLCARLNVSELAWSVNLSSSRLRHLFKKEKGVTLAEYQRLSRMEDARLLLLSTFLSIKEVMTLVGIHDDGHFAREFKRDCGFSPTDYRRTAKLPVLSRLPSPQSTLRDLAND